MSDEYEEYLKTYRHQPYDEQIFHWSEYLRALSRDIERRKRLNAKNQNQTIIVTPQKRPYKQPFFIALLVIVSSWVWMVPVLANKSDWFWQTVGQVICAMIIGAVYFKFSRKKWFETVGVVLFGVLTALLLQQIGWEQQLITAGWTVAGGLVLAFVVFRIGWNK